MITRSVCKITEGYESKLLDKLSNHVSAPIIEAGISLRNVVKLNPKIQSDNIKYVSGRLYYQKLFDVKDFEIKDSGEIKENDKIIRRTLMADFWIKHNPGLILFQTKAKSEAGSKIISQLLFGNENSIEQLKFKIEDIEKDARSRKLRGMWTFSFKDRQGKIKTGQLTGDDDVDNDPMFGLTVGAPRNYIGIKKVLNNEITKIKINRSGSITFFTSEDDLATEIEIHDTIESFLPYGYFD